MVMTVVMMVLMFVSCWQRALRLVPETLNLAVNSDFTITEVENSDLSVTEQQSTLECSF